MKRMREEISEASTEENYCNICLIQLQFQLWVRKKLKKVTSRYYYVILASS
jgi:hypothetical protein